MKKNLLIIISLLLTISGFAQNPFQYDIKYQRLEFTVNPAVCYIQGAVTTYFTSNNNNFSEIAFSLSENLTVDSIIYHSQNIDFTHNSDTILINFPKHISINILDSLTIHYQGEPEDEWNSFVIDEHNDVPILWTLSEPYGAKSWFPCKQILTDKTDSIDIFVTAPKEYKVAGIGLLMSEKITGELKISHWKHRYPITAYLIAIAVTNYVEYYDYVEINDTLTIPILNYVYPEDLAYSQENSPNIIDVFQFFCDSFMLYPFYEEKYGHAQFGRNGGMEHQTMSFMVNFGHSLMAHELAHQWFGNYITCGTWSDIWLNEAFAVYLEGMTAEQGLADYTWLEWKTNRIAHITSELDGSVFCPDTTERSRIFDSRLTYSKGGMVLHTLRWKLGDKIFFQSIRNYLHDPKLAYNFARTEDLIYHFEQTCQCDLTEFFNDWYYSEGYPIYTINWSQNQEKKITFTIEQTPSHKSVDFFEMKIPIQFIGYEKDTLIIFDNTFSGQKFVCELDFIVNNVIFDPEKWIISSGATINHYFNNNNEFNIKIIPNPLSENIFVYFPVETQINKYLIYNSLGQIIVEKNISEYTQRLQINFSNFQDGIYYIHLQTNNGNYTKKIVKLK